MLALLEKATSDLFKLSFEEILNHFRVLPFKVNVDALIERSFSVTLKNRWIEKYFNEQKLQQNQEQILKETLDKS